MLKALESSSIMSTNGKPVLAGKAGIGEVIFPKEGGAHRLKYVHTLFEEPFKATTPLIWMFSWPTLCGNLALKF